MSISTLRNVFKNHPILKGMVTYSIIWPTGSLIQQTMEGKNWRTYNYQQCLNFAIFGTFYVAPTLYGWVKISSQMWPVMNLKMGLTKAIVEQFSYGPFAGVSFFFGMSLLERKTFDQAVQEVRTKFPDTYKVGICVWPVIQTINFALIPEHNRVPFVSICSLLWTTFLAYMKQRTDNIPQSSPATITINPVTTVQ
ncbi:mpv17-like protein [Toxorhynchites rutilus septentrionalis]|uniref:mpv17-like protein n=1 Tax=Toxorhynchites rutilus septentrionalis TaxID=329112 RepID=UPI00247A9117|nr:mpv17-like protein [Toxorhynchites rutilus septentrionalis]XP_055618538.1 mpv17-like protein [Toxorhynchites rutilus septentrionalis]XP_055618547.1 mpv17-like protein [Toxorhynchites rutilus septentrionalis]